MLQCYNENDQLNNGSCGRVNLASQERRDGLRRVCLLGLIIPLALITE
jgi:hypothetical protein